MPKGRPTSAERILPKGFVNFIRQRERHPPTVFSILLHIKQGVVSNQTQHPVLYIPHRTNEGFISPLVEKISINVEINSTNVD